jgi:hypothetical protein
MANEADLADETIDREINGLIAQASAAAKLVVVRKPTGKCRWCEEPTLSVYCSPECKNDDDYHEKRKKQNQ